ncbi:triose-phosphate isomerase [Enterococcus sp. ALS3]|uniref:Triose-phosphate isomerase n=2 Tax=Enterococcus alishanensis TaxID=1303817 RepID=A0ABS6TH56_9ENTE|nr:triose-phosphate isomerase [Enterococcus alishanensis]MBV7392182.1 triose-phosphate isomerase [Enterococcus alishanensis]
MMTKIKKPFFVFNPKSYLYGEELLKLAQKADEMAAKYPEITVMVTVPFADISNIANQTENLIVTAQHIDGITPGRGIGHVLPESVYYAGARAVFLNHAERPLTLTELTKSMQRAQELGIETIVCADSLAEARAIANLKPTAILCEPTELIGTGQTSDESYITATNQVIKEVDENILVMQAAGISTPEDVYRTMKLGADGTGCTSGITNADSPIQMLEEMIVALNQAYQERG